MKLITRQIRANRAAERWKEAYYSDGQWKQYNIKTPEIYKNLIALGDNPNPDDVDAVIGNDSWTEVDNCDECGEKEERVVMIGEEPDYESQTACICLKCLKNALVLIV